MSDSISTIVQLEEISEWLSELANSEIPAAVALDLSIISVRVQALADYLNSPTGDV